MSAKIKKTRLLINIAIIAILVSGSIIAIKIAKGYRPSFKDMSLNGTGLLAVSSYPKQAKVLINDHLSTTTDNTLYLKPDIYKVQIIKEGFHAWQKDIPLKEELVSIATARLFPIIPSTTPLTFYQAQNIAISPDSARVAFVLTGSPFKENNGLYVLGLDNALLGSKQISQIADQSSYDYRQASLLWSPDNSQILASFQNKKSVTASHLLSTKSFNQAKSVKDVTVQLPLVLSEWQTQFAKIDQPAFNKMPDFIQDILKNSSQNVYFSPDQKKVLYTPTKDINLPDNTIKLTLPNINSSPETRNLKTNQTYVYDVEEGANYLIPVSNQDSSDPTNTKILLVLPSPATTSAESAQPVTKTGAPQLSIKQLKNQTDSGLTTNIRWHPDSNHLIVTQKNKVQIIEFDGLNLTTIIEAPIIESFSVSSPDGNRLIILTSLNQQTDQQNLISIDLK